MTFPHDRRRPPDLSPSSRTTTACAFSPSHLLRLLQHTYPPCIFSLTLNSSPYPNTVFLLRFHFFSFSCHDGFKETEALPAEGMELPHHFRTGQLLHPGRAATVDFSFTPTISNADSSFSIQIILLGDSGVGKTSLFYRYTSVKTPSPLNSCPHTCFSCSLIIPTPLAHRYVTVISE